MGRKLAWVAPGPAFHTHCAASAESLAAQCLSAWNLETVWFIFQTLTLKIDLGSLTAGERKGPGRVCCVKRRGRVPVNPWACAPEAPCAASTLLSSFPLFFSDPDPTIPIFDIWNIGYLGTSEESISLKW